jgi:drug/metabolite transporter (DMT)-like permease
MEHLWILVAVIAASLQTIRSAYQKKMIPQLGEFGATYIRFIYALPFTLLIFIFWFYFLNNAIPELSHKSIIFCLIGAFCQVAFTLSLMIVFSFRNFAAGIAFSKTEVLFAALVEMFILNIYFLGVFAVVFLSIAKQNSNISDVFKKIYTSLFSIGTLLGVITGMILAGSTIGYRLAIISIDSPILDATIYLSAIAIVAQTFFVGLWLILYKKEQLYAVIKFWRPSLPAGISGSGATAGWFIAFALASVAEVRAVGQIELIFSILVSILIFREKINKTEVIGIMLLATSILIVIFARI